MRIEIISFSYKRGCPGDTAGNGGGFVFDCRALPNPFWEESLRKYVGYQPGIEKFFEGHIQMVDEFLSAAMTMVKASIHRYQEDGRSNLQIAFGCTGGQHRSVYCAVQFAKRLSHEIAGIDISLKHTAQKFWKT